MTDQTTEVPEDREFVGYGPAAEHLGLQRNTLSSYVARGIGPAVAKNPDGSDRREIVGQYVLPVFLQSELDRWRDERPGQGARTDLAPAAAA
jgi:hypothetical protein